MKNLAWTNVSLRDRMTEGACWLSAESSERSLHSPSACPGARASRCDDPEPKRPSLNEEAVRTAFTRYRDGDDKAGSDLLELLFNVRNGWARSLQWYKGVSWDLAHGAVLDTILYIHEKARAKEDENGRRFDLPPRGMRKFIYQLVRRQYWLFRRRAHQTHEERRDEKAKRGEAASKFLPRIIPVAEIPDTVPALAVTKSALEGLLLKQFLKLSARKRAMALARFEGIPYKEIARMTWTTERAARVHVSTLIATLRKCVEIEKSKEDLTEKAARRAQ